MAANSSLSLNLYGKLFVVVALRFYGPLTNSRSYQAQSVMPTTLFLGKPKSSLPYKVHIVLQLTEKVFLNQAKYE